MEIGTSVEPIFGGHQPHLPGYHHWKKETWVGWGPNSPDASWRRSTGRWERLRRRIVWCGRSALISDCPIQSDHTVLVCHLYYSPIYDMKRSATQEIFKIFVVDMNTRSELQDTPGTWRDVDMNRGATQEIFKSFEERQTPETKKISFRNFTKNPKRTHGVTRYT